MRNEIKDMLIASAILSAILFLPDMFGGSDPFISYGISVICQLLFLLYLGNILARAGAFRKPNQDPYWKNLLILLPTVTLFLAIPTACILDPGLVFLTNSEYFWIVLLSTVLTAINDELLFRIIIFRRIGQNSRIKRILVSAGIFALFEILNLFSNFSILITVMQMGHAFVLGLFLGFIVEYGHSIYPAILFHFLYLFFRESYVYLYYSTSYLTVVLDLYMPLFAIAYLALSYIIYFRKKE